MKEPYKHPNTPDPAHQLLTNWFNSQRYDSNKKPHGIYKASSAMKCHRQTYYRRQNVEPDEDADPLPLGLFEQGNNTERSFVRALRWRYGAGNVLGEVAENDEQSWVKKEIPNDPDPLLVRGLPDAVVLDYNLEPWIVYEVKSKSKVKDYTDLSLHHAAQALLYHETLEPEHLRVVYLGRNTMDERKEYAYDGDGVWRNVTEDGDLGNETYELSWRDVEDWYEQLHGYEENDIVPPAIPYQSWECQFCDFKDRCREDGHEFGEPGMNARGWPGDSS